MICRDAVARFPQRTTLFLNKSSTSTQSRQSCPSGTNYLWTTPLASKKTMNVIFTFDLLVFRVDGRPERGSSATSSRPFLKNTLTTWKLGNRREQSFLNHLMGVGEAFVRFSTELDHVTLFDSLLCRREKSLTRYTASTGN